MSPIVPPQNSKFKDFSIIKHWGNLSPYHTVKSHGLPSSSQIIPKGCELEQMHWLQRHGARYPTTNPNGPAGLAARLKASKFKASGKLKFLNDWDYKLGAELLTPFGRSQLYNLGVSARIKYGFLLDRMNGTKPVFRTESQDRMLRSAQNFAAGFFGIPDEDQYNLLVMIEAPGFNCSLAPYHSCPNDNKLYPNVNAKLATWDFIYLKDARKRLQKMIKGYDVSIQDARDMVSSLITVVTNGRCTCAPMRLSLSATLPSVNCSPRRSGAAMSTAAASIGGTPQALAAPWLAPRGWATCRSSPLA